MKYIFLVLSSLVLAFCSGPSEVIDSNNESKLSSEKDTNSSFNRLPTDIIRLIATFMEPEEIVNLRYMNCLTLSSLSLKRLVEQIFNISGLENISDNEPELAGVMRLAHTSHDPFLFFKALTNDIICEKKPYNVLFRPLILHLFQYLPGILNKRKHYQYYKNHVENSTIKVCLKKGKIDLVLEIVNDKAYLSGKALQIAVLLGHTSNVEILLQSCTDIPSHNALQGASIDGHTSIVELLLQRCNDISAFHAGWALKYAADYGHTSIVELLLQSRTDIAADFVGWALQGASENEHISIVELLLQSHINIPADVSRALRRAVENGHTPIVELLHSRNDLSAGHVGRALNEVGDICYCLIS
jgi:hypothetical protein